jgi:predicted metalloprotease with PDZ domain
VDAAAAIDRTAWDNTFISYYTFGAAIGLGLDLSLRDRSDGRTTLDTYMQAMWAKHGRPGQKEPGMVATPYTMDDLEEVLAEVSGDRQFAQAFFARYIQGHEVVDYGPLLAKAGLVTRRPGAGKAALTGSQLSFTGSAGARVTGQVLFGSALYQAGVDRDDLIVSIDGVSLSSEDVLNNVLRKRKPGDQGAIRFVRPSGEAVTGTVRFDENPRIEIVPIEQSGGVLTPAQKRFRDDWLQSKQH